MAVDYYESLRDEYEDIKYRLEESTKSLHEYRNQRGKLDELKIENKNLKEYVKTIETNYKHKELKLFTQISELKKRLTYIDEKKKPVNIEKVKMLKINILREDLLLEKVFFYYLENKSTSKELVYSG
jgi:predicted nuclease with TOPRIM domain